jgi:hypothetical protein
VIAAITEEQQTTITDWMNERDVPAYRIVAIEPDPPATKGSTSKAGAVATVTMIIRDVRGGIYYAVNGIGEMIPDPREESGA